MSLYATTPFKMINRKYTPIKSLVVNGSGEPALWFHPFPSLDHAAESSVSLVFR